MKVTEKIKNSLGKFFIDLFAVYTSQSMIAHMELVAVGVVGENGDPCAINCWASRVAYSNRVVSWRLGSWDHWRLDNLNRIEIFITEIEKFILLLTWT